MIFLIMQSPWLKLQTHISVTSKHRVHRRWLFTIVIIIVVVIVVVIVIFISVSVCIKITIKTLVGVRT